MDGIKNHDTSVTNKILTLHLQQVNMTTANLHAIMAEEEASVSRGSHLQTGSAAPYRWLSDEKLERAALIALVTLTEHIYEDIHKACNVRFLNAKDLMLHKYQ